MVAGSPRNLKVYCRSRTSKHPTQFYHKSSFRLWEIKTREQTRKNPDWACPADWSLTIWSGPGGVRYTGARRAPKRPLRVAGHRLKSRETREPRRTPWQSGGCHRKVPVQVRERSGPWFSGAREVAGSGRGKRIGQWRRTRAAIPTPHPVAHRCCSPTSPRVITCGTSSCVGHSPEAMHPNTPHSSRIPNSSSSMSPPKTRGGTRRGARGLSTNQ